MSGHSKWTTIKRKKGAADAQRAKQWGKLLRFVVVAARDGGGSIDANPNLATAVSKAKTASVPNDNITRAIKRGTGELEGETYEEAGYEGYGPGGVAMLCDALTNNRNRTSQDLRAIFRKYNGSLAEPNSVAWQFERRGVILVDRGPHHVLGDAGDPRNSWRNLLAIRKRDQARMRVRDYVANSGPADFKEMPSRRRGRGLAVDHKHVVLRQRLGTTAWHHCHDLITRAPLRSRALA